MTGRREGWYWIKESSEAVWEAAQWEHGQWCGDSEQFLPAVIGSRIPTPDEPWQTVPKKLNKSMRMEFHRTNELCETGKDDGSGSPDFQWKAMLKAAPSPESTS